MSRTPQRRPTLLQVADATGFSSSTVSRALQDDPRVTEPTRNRIKETAARLGFSRNTPASSLRSGRASSLVGLLIPDFRDPFFAAVAAGLQEEASRHHIEVIIGCHNDSTQNQERLIRQMASHRVQAIVIAPAPGASPAQLAAEMKFGTTVVSLDRPSPELGCDLVTSENVSGARKLTLEMLKRGHRKFGVITLQTGIWTQRVRLQAVRDTLQEAGIDLDPEAVVSLNPDGTFPERPLNTLFFDKGITAVISLSVMATVPGLTAALARDLELDWASFDGHPLFDLLDATILCIEQDASEVGKAAMVRLAERQEHAGLPPEEVMVPLGAPITRGRGARRG